MSIVFVGPSGSGKTTAIASVSEIPPRRARVTDVNSAHAALDAAAEITVDVGQLGRGSDAPLRLVGVPAAPQLRWLRRSLAARAKGVVVLIDPHRHDPEADLASHLNELRTPLAEGRVVVGVGGMPGLPPDATARYMDVLHARRAIAPVLAVDLRERDDVLTLIDALLHHVRVGESLL